MKVEIGEQRRRGDTLETVVHDLTRVGHPPAASVFLIGGEYIIVPVNSQFPVLKRETYNEAINFVEQIIPDE